MDNQTANIVAESLKLLAKRKMGGVPIDAVPFEAQNTTEIDGTTLRDIAAAPGTGQSYYITEMTISNRTSAEDPTIVVQDDTGTPIEIWRGNLDRTGPATVNLKFEPPINVASNKKIQGKALTAVGDTIVHCRGFKGAS